MRRSCDWALGGWFHGWVEGVACELGLGGDAGDDEFAAGDLGHARSLLEVSGLRAGVNELASLHWLLVARLHRQECLCHIVAVHSSRRDFDLLAWKCWTTLALLSDNLSHL